MREIHQSQLLIHEMFNQKLRFNADCFSQVFNFLKFCTLQKRTSEFCVLQEPKILERKDKNI